MKRLYYTLLAILTFASCSEEALITDGGRDDSDKVTLTFSLGVPESGSVTTRSFGEIDDAKRLRLAVHLFVFDNNGFFVESATAVNKVNPDSAQTNFEVTLTKSSSQRRIHFVAVDTVAAGSGKTFSDVVTMKYSYGSETTMINGMSVTDHNGAYWQRVVLDDGISETTKFTRVPLIRNFNHFTAELGSELQKNDHFTLTGLALLHRPTKGSVAPYNTLTGEFQIFNDGDSMKTYHKIAADGQYQGYSPNDNGWEETDSTNVTFVNPATGIYMYGTRNATGAGIQGRTYAIIKGIYKANGTTYNDRYYKIDIIYKNADGTASFYNILRNFHFRIIIQSVTFEGYASAAEAARAPATNNISASVQAQTVNNISDGSARRLFVNNLYFMFNKDGVSNGDILCKFFGYTNPEATETGWRNSNINVSVLPGSDDIFTEGGQPTIDGGTMDDNNWSKVSFTLKDPTTIPQTATLRFAVQGVERFETLYRDVTVVLRKPYQMLVDCQDIVPNNTDEGMFVNLLVPDGINTMLFPLTFYVEGAQKTLYPDVSQNQLPVHVGSSIVSGSSSNSFQYEKTLTSAIYDAATTKVVGNDTYRVIPLYFKTNVAASATTVYVANPYFTTASCSFQNGTPMFPQTDDMEVTVIPSDYFGAGNSYHYVKFLTVTNTGQVKLTLKEGDTTWTDYINLATTTDTHALQHTSVNNGDGTYTHTVRIPTQTFSGSSYEVTVEPYNAGYTQSFGTTATLNRGYIYIPIGSFETNIGSDGYLSSERFRSYTGGVNTGRIGFTSLGTTEYDTNYPRSERTDGGFTWSGSEGYHISTANITGNGGTVTEATQIRFFDPSSHNHTTYDGETYVTGWEASVNVGDLTNRHAVDVAAGATETTGTAAGLYKWQLTFAAP